MLSSEGGRGRTLKASLLRPVPPSRAPRSRRVFTTRRTCDALTLKPEAALRRDSELDLAHEPYGGLENLRGSAIATIIAMNEPRSSAISARAAISPIACRNLRNMRHLAFGRRGGPVIGVLQAGIHSGKLCLQRLPSG